MSNSDLCYGPKPPFDSGSDKRNPILGLVAAQSDASLSADAWRICELSYGPYQLSGVKQT